MISIALLRACVTSHGGTRAARAAVRARWGVNPLLRAREGPTRRVSWQGKHQPDNKALGVLDVPESACPPDSKSPGSRLTARGGAFLPCLGAPLRLRWRVAGASPRPPAALAAGGWRRLAAADQSVIRENHRSHHLYVTCFCFASNLLSCCFIAYLPRRDRSPGGDAARGRACPAARARRGGPIGMAAEAEAVAAEAPQDAAPPSARADDAAGKADAEGAPEQVAAAAAKRAKAVARLPKPDRAALDAEVAAQQATIDGKQARIEELKAAIAARRQGGRSSAATGPRTKLNETRAKIKARIDERKVRAGEIWGAQGAPRTKIGRRGTRADGAERAAAGDSAAAAGAQRCCWPRPAPTAPCGAGGAPWPQGVWKGPCHAARSTAAAAALRTALPADADRREGCSQQPPERPVATHAAMLATRSRASWEVCRASI